MHLKRKEMRKTGRYKIGCHVALEREVLGHPTLLEFLYFLCFFMFFLCLISFKSLRGCVKFFYGFPGKYNLCKVCLSVSCIHGWDPHGGNSKETIFRTVYKILP